MNTPNLSNLDHVFRAVEGRVKLLDRTLNEQRLFFDKTSYKPGGITRVHNRQKRELEFRQGPLLRRAKQYIMERRAEAKTDLMESYLGMEWQDFERGIYSIPDEHLSKRVKRKVELAQRNLRNRRVGRAILLDN